MGADNPFKGFRLNLTPKKPSEPASEDDTAATSDGTPAVPKPAAENGSSVPSTQAASPAPASNEGGAAPSDGTAAVPKAEPENDSSAPSTQTAAPTLATKGDGTATPDGAGAVPEPAKESSSSAPPTDTTPPAPTSGGGAAANPDGTTSTPKAEKESGTGAPATRTEPPKTGTSRLIFGRGDKNPFAQFLAAKKSPGTTSGGDGTATPDGTATEPKPEKENDSGTSGNPSAPPPTNFSGLVPRIRTGPSSAVTRKSRTGPNGGFHYANKTLVNNNGQRPPGSLARANKARLQQAPTTPAPQQTPALNPAASPFKLPQETPTTQAPPTGGFTFGASTGGRLGPTFPTASAAPVHLAAPTATGEPTATTPLSAPASQPASSTEPAPATPATPQPGPQDDDEDDLYTSSPRREGAQERQPGDAAGGSGPSRPADSDSEISEEE